MPQYLSLFPTHAIPAPQGSVRWRDYQIAAVDKCLKHLETKSGGLLVLPCGTGKTEIIVMLLQALATGESRGLVVSPLDPLVAQTAERLRSRGLPCGVEQGRQISDQRITVASYKSLISRERYQAYTHNVSVVLVDESHLNYSKRAMDILSVFRECGSKIIGLTASPDRLKGDPLTEFYGDCAYYYELQQAIDDGWLVPPRIWLSVASDLDLSQFDSGFGDYSAERLAKEMSRDSLVQTVANLVLQHHEGEPSVVYCQGVFQAERVRTVLARGGLEAAIVHSRMDRDERFRHLGLFEAGELNVILNVGCLTTGWDCPMVKKLFCCKPTKSRSLYQQMVGRGTRPWPASMLVGLETAEERRAAIAASQKPFFEIFDLVDASRHNDLITSVDALRGKEEIELLKRAKGKRKPDTPMSPTDLDRLLAVERELMAEEAAQEARQRAAQEALTERQRAAWLAGVEFGNYERPAFLRAESRPSQRGWRVPFGKERGRLIREVDTGLLHWLLKARGIKEPLRAAIQREIKSRNN